MRPSALGSLWCWRQGLGAQPASGSRRSGSGSWAGQELGGEGLGRAESGSHSVGERTTLRRRNGGGEDEAQMRYFKEGELAEIIGGLPVRQLGIQDSSSG